MTLKAYLASDALTGTATITAIDTEPAPHIRIDTTLFHPQGGGQRGDRGRIGPAQVIDTRHAAEGEVDHFVESVDGVAVGDVIEIAVDAEYRREGARLHSAGHLLADAVQAIRPGLHAVAGHHWKGEARVEFEGAVEVDEALEADLAAKIVELVAAALPVRVVGDPHASRALAIGDFTPVGCGGLHVSSTAELDGLAVTAIRSKKGRLRVSYEVA
ncbi:MAG: alanyl-tRNA editing protein [Sphingobium sp.]